MNKFASQFLPAVFLALLSGCGGGSGGSTALPIANPAAPPAVASGIPGAFKGPMTTAHFTLTLPQYGKKTAGSHGKRKPQSVPYSSASIVFTVNGTLAATVDLTSGPSGLYFVTVPVPLGGANITADIYDHVQAGCASAPTPCGNKIATAFTSTTITLAGPNNISLTLQGIIAQVCVYADPGLIRLGSNSTASYPYNLYVYPEDVDGDFIGDSTFYNGGFILRESDHSGNTSLNSGASFGSSLTFTGGYPQAYFTWDSTASGSVSFTALSNDGKLTPLPCLYPQSQITFGGPYLYVSDPANGVVDIIDQTNAVTATKADGQLTVGGAGYGVQRAGAVLYDANTSPQSLLVADAAGSFVSVWDADDNQFVTFAQAGKWPASLAVSPSTPTKVYAANSGDDTVSLIDLAILNNPSTSTVAGSFDPGSSPRSIAVQATPGPGEIAYVGERFPNGSGNNVIRSVTFGNLDAQPIPSQNGFGSPVLGIAYSQLDLSGCCMGSLFIRETRGNESWDLNTGSTGYITESTVPAEPVAEGPNIVTVSPDGSVVLTVGGDDQILEYVHSGGGFDQVYCYSADKTGTCGSPGSPAERPVGTAFSAIQYGARVYAFSANFGNGSVSVLDPTQCQEKFVHQIPVGGTPFSITSPPTAYNPLDWC